MNFRALILTCFIGFMPITSAVADDSFILTSPDVENGKTIDNKHIFNGFGCSGLNVSPALNWKGAPQDTKSFAVTVYDPDAPTGSGWWHWVVYGIPADQNGIKGGNDFNNWLAKVELASGVWVQGRNDFGQNAYGGPCPPVGDKPHRYIFTVFALKTDKIDVPEGASAAMIGFNLNANKLATASFTALYGR